MDTTINLLTIPWSELNLNQRAEAERRAYQIGREEMLNDIPLAADSMEIVDYESETDPASRYLNLVELEVSTGQCPESHWSYWQAVATDRDDPRFAAFARGWQQRERDMHQDAAS